jgi:hypothetical protein
VCIVEWSFRDYVTKMRRAKRILREVADEKDRINFQQRFLDACRFSPCDVLSMLQRGVDIHFKDEEGLTALHIACWYQPCLVELLLDHDADIHARSIFGETPLHIACEHQPSVVRVLLERGADVHHVSQKGWSALHLVCEYHPYMIPLLLEYGANRHIKDWQGKTPIAFLREQYPHLSSMVEMNVDEPYDEREIGPCVVCTENKRAVILGCSHFVLCYACSDKLKSCPVCRVRIYLKMGAHV